VHDSVVYGTDCCLQKH